MRFLSAAILFTFILVFLFSAGCTALRTFPMTARAGDTVTMGIGYDVLEERKQMSRADTVVTIVKDDLSYTAAPPLRGVFQLYPDPNSKLANYESVYLPTPALDGDPFETVIVFDLPTDVPAGSYDVTVTSPHLYSGFTQTLEVIPGTGASNPLTDNGSIDRDITELERAPTVTVSLDPGYTIGALSMVLDFDETAVDPSDINLQQPRYVFGPGSFQETQRMFYFDDDGSQITVNILCPDGVSSDYIRFDLLYPEGSPDPAFTIISQKTYDIDGNEIPGVGASMN